MKKAVLPGVLGLVLIVSLLLPGCDKVAGSGEVITEKKDFTGFTSLDIGSAFEVSIGDTVKLVAEVMDRKIETVSDEQRIRPAASEVERLYADNSKARKLLKWSPRFAGISGFKQGLQKTVAWFTNHDNIKHYKSHIYNV